MTNNLNIMLKLAHIGFKYLTNSKDAEQKLSRSLGSEGKVDSHPPPGSVKSERQSCSGGKVATVLKNKQKNPSKFKPNCKRPSASSQSPHTVHTVCLLSAHL